MPTPAMSLPVKPSLPPPHVISLSVPLCPALAPGKVIKLQLHDKLHGWWATWWLRTTLAKLKQGPSNTSTERSIPRGRHTKSLCVFHSSPFKFFLSEIPTQLLLEPQKLLFWDVEQSLSFEQNVIQSWCSEYQSQCMGFKNNWPPSNLAPIFFRWKNRFLCESALDIGFFIWNPIVNISRMQFFWHSPWQTLSCFRFNSHRSALSISFGVCFFLSVKVILSFRLLSFRQ